MTTKTYTITLEVDDASEADLVSYDAEDIEIVLEDILRENLPNDLSARILEVTDESVR